MVVDVDAVFSPAAACLGVRTLDYELVQHCLNDFRYGPNVLFRLYLASARRTRLAAARLWSPGMIETLAAEVMLAQELDGLIEGRVADQADQVAVGRGYVFERLELGGHFDDSALSTLR